MLCPNQRNECIKTGSKRGRSFYRPDVAPIHLKPGSSKKAIIKYIKFFPKLYVWTVKRFDFVSLFGQKTFRTQLRLFNPTLLQFRYKSFKINFKKMKKEKAKIQYKFRNFYFTEYDKKWVCRLLSK